ncbi:MAG: hypothetical protein J2P48_17180 [Alphaproteobacteria bacterium]|nr:hypothetical protein [Alphaproteobacteria bacterium]
MLKNLPYSASIWGMVACLGAEQALASDLPHLFDQLKKPSYHAAFSDLFGGQKDLDPWLRGYLRNRNGVDTPGQSIEAGRYELYNVCKPHDCPGNVLYTMFVPGGSKAWALLTRDGRIERFFGHPGSLRRAILIAQCKIQAEDIGLEVCDG